MITKYFSSIVLSMRNHKTINMMIKRPRSGKSAAADKFIISDRVKISRDVNEKQIIHVKLNHPETLNALDIKTFEDLAQTAVHLRSKANVRAVILSGEGRAFCSGLNVKSILSKRHQDSKSDSSIFPFFANMDRLLKRPCPTIKTEMSDEEVKFAIGNLAQNVGYLWRQIPVPVIAALHGCCLGGGLQIALGADMRFSTVDCKLSIMEAKWGLVPDMSGSITLRELLPIDVAKELTMTGRIIRGSEADQLGLVTRCVDDPLMEAVKVSKEIIERSPDSVAASKLLFQETWVDASEEYCLSAETRLQKNLICSWNQVAASMRNFGLSIPYRSVSQNKLHDKNKEQSK